MARTAGAAATVRSVLRVVTWNLWWRFPLGDPAPPFVPWQQRQPAILATLAALDADVVCLQEVWAEEHGPDQGAWLAAELGLHLAHPPGRFRNGLSFRNAVLSRWPVREAATTPLVAGVRTAAHAVLDTPFGPVPVVTTHLSWAYDGSAERIEQARALAHLAASLHPGQDGFPVIVAGDLNATPTSDEVRLLTGEAPVPVPGFVLHDLWAQAGDGSPGHTWTRANPYLAGATWPERRIDHLLVGWPRPRPVGNPVRCWLIGDRPVDGVWPSDHLGVAADLRTPLD